MQTSKISELPTTCFVWPWRGANNEKISFKEILSTRKFTISYLLITFLIVSILGFASTRERDCTGTWQFGLFCDYSFWAKNLIENPLIFFRSLITTPYIHNSIDHLGYITILFLLVVQSYEVRCGSLKTFLVFTFSNFLMPIIFALIFNIGVSLWPDIDFFTYAFERSWIGGSVGFTFIYGILIWYCKRPYQHAMILVSLEFLNLFVLDIVPQISFIHFLSFIGGVVLKKSSDRV